jgi:hypothetical protein
VERGSSTTFNNGNLDLPHVKRGKKYLFPTHEIALYLETRLDESKVPI